MTVASGDGHAGSSPASPSGRVAAPGSSSTGPGGGDAWGFTSSAKTYTVSGHVDPPPSSAFDDLIGARVSVTGSIFGDAEGVVTGSHYEYDDDDEVCLGLVFDVTFIDGRTGTVKL